MKIRLDALVQNRMEAKGFGQEYRVGKLDVMQKKMVEITETREMDAVHAELLRKWII